MKKYFLIVILTFLLCLFVGCGKETSKYTVIKEVKVNVNYDEYKATLETENVEIVFSGTKEREYIKIVLTAYSNYIFSTDTVIYINNEKVTENYSMDSSEHEITYKYKNPNYVEDPEKILNEVRFNLDTVKYTGESLSENYTIKVEVDKNYTYITTTVTLKDGYKLGSDFSVYVNDKLIPVTDNLYKINDERTELIYKIKDPNWTPTY